jgi:hypothetical protein
MKYLWSLLAGVAATYILNFIYKTSQFPDVNTGTFIAHAFNLALPYLIAIIAIAIAIGILDWWLRGTTKAKDNILHEAEALANAIKSKAQEEVDAIKGNAAYEALEIRDSASYEGARIISEAEAYKQQLVQEHHQLDALRDTLEAEFEKKRQHYVEELDGLRRKNKILADELAEARRAGVKKMRQEGNDGGARRLEKKLSKQLADLT